MRYLIFDDSVDGHHLEYIHHIHEATVERTCDTFIICVPSNFLEVKDKFNWTDAPNIKFVFIPDPDLTKIRIKSTLKKCWNTSRFIKRIAVRENVNRIFLINLSTVNPILPVILPNSIKLSGIVYKIHLYSIRSSIRKAIDHIRYVLLTKNSSTQNILLLNDKEAVGLLSDTYKSSKFKFLPDPVVDIKESELVDIHDKMNIPARAKIYAHIGAMTDRKGTIEILESILSLDKNQLESRYFIFAGKVNYDIKQSFYNLLNNCRKHGANIHVIDEFCEYSLFASICKYSDVILIPYKSIDISSGIIGYASKFKTPVIGPEKGLIGNLINHYKLGITIPNITPLEISKAILSPTHMASDQYALTHTVRNFTNTILD